MWGGICYSIVADVGRLVCAVDESGCAAAMGSLRSRWSGRLGSRDYRRSVGGIEKQSAPLWLSVDHIQRARQELSRRRQMEGRPRSEGSGTAPDATPTALPAATPTAATRRGERGSVHMQRDPCRLQYWPWPGLLALLPCARTEIRARLRVSRVITA